jgi:hypothetical protein
VISLGLSVHDMLFMKWMQSNYNSAGLTPLHDMLFMKWMQSNYNSAGLTPLAGKAKFAKEVSQ